MKAGYTVVAFILLAITGCSKSANIPIDNNIGDTTIPSGQFKPQLSGVFYRDGIPNNVPADYAAILDGFVVRADWSQLQPEANGDIAPNIIDTAITYVRQWNDSHPQQQWHLKIRVYAGAYSPQWVKDEFGTIMLKGDVIAGEPESALVPKFWESGYLNAFNDLVVKLAAKYDDVPEIREVTTPALVTFTAEPMIRHPSPENMKTYIDNGYSAATDLIQQRSAIALLKAWKQTRFSISFSPYEYITSDATLEISLTDTENLIDYFVQLFGKQAVLANNGLRDSTSINAIDFQPGGTHYAMYQYMYGYHRQDGIPVMFQTEKTKDIGNLGATIQQGINLGAAAIELPDEFETMISTTDLQRLREGLKANAVQ